MSAPFTGRAVDRVDARRKVTGTADYAAETAVANVAHAVIVTSTIARGRILAIDTHGAEHEPGVLAIINHTNAPKLPGWSKKNTPVDRVLQLFQEDRIFYGDQPIALVVADSLERAQFAASRVVARYETEAVTVDLAGELPQAYTPAAAGPGGKADSSRGDIVKGLADAKVKVEQTYTTATQHHNPMEMHATIAVWQGDDHVTIYDSTQGIFGVRQRVATIFGIEKEKVRVISHFVGGGFGCKGSPWSHIGLAAMAAKVVGRGVKLMLSRQQMFMMVGHRPRTIQKLTLGADQAGKLLAVKHEVTSETARFDEFVEPAALQTRMLYASPNLVTSHRLVKLDIGMPTFTRAPGEASGTFALESAMDELSYALSIDPIELRLRNYAERDPGENKPWSSKSLRECYQRGAEQFGWKKRKPAPRSMKEGHLLVGMGMASATYPARQSPASAMARMRPDGSAVVQAGSQDIGTGTYTIMSQIAADALGLSLEKIRFELGDTALPETPGSGGSQTASSVGSAVKQVGIALRRALAEQAAGDAQSPLHGLNFDALDAADGALFAKSDPSKRDSFGAIVTRSGKPEISARVDNKAKEGREKFSSHSFGAQFAEVKIDEDLGEIRVTRFTGAFAAGKILNLKTARNQFHGGIVWGIGLALLEQTHRDPRTARVVTRDLADYHVPVNADVPAIEVIMVEEEDPHVNEIGAKGIGEIGITGAAAAIANAVYHATGKRIRDLPITLDKLL